MTEIARECRVSRKRYRVLLIAVCAVAGCSMISYDVTHSDLTKNLLDGCYQTAIESELYQMSPAQASGKKTDTYLLQTGLPYNEWNTGSYGQSWEKIAEVPIGTRIAVTQVFNQAWGNEGRYWLLYGRLVESELLDKEFIIPSGNYTKTGQIWISPASPEVPTPIRFQPYFVKSCPGG